MTKAIILLWKASLRLSTESWAIFHMHPRTNKPYLPNSGTEPINLFKSKPYLITPFSPSEVQAVVRMEKFDKDPSFRESVLKKRESERGNRSELRFVSRNPFINTT
jgi:hypothetical protein